MLTVEARNEVPLATGILYPHMSTATVSIRVMDENESPYFEPDPKLIKLEEGMMPESALTIFTAQDPDRFTRQKITYVAGICFTEKFTGKCTDKKGLHECLVPKDICPNSTM